MSWRLNDDSGMTLIELLVSISVLGIIIGPITMSMLLGLLTTSGTKERISDSAAAQLISAYFVTDVESSNTVDTATGSPSCGSDSGTVKVRFTWSDPTDSSDVTKQTLVEYIDRPTGDEGLHELWRYECDRSATPVVRSQQRLVRQVDFSGLPVGTLAVSCNTPEVACPTGASRSVNDGVTVNGNTTVVSPTVAFTAADVGASISGDGIPGGTTITSVTSGSAAVISAAASATGTGITLKLGPPASVTMNVRVNANSGTNPKTNSKAYDPYTFTLRALRRETQ
jgi:prepilin-type N-terminal cleavage/methylation domain-containing protein